MNGVIRVSSQYLMETSVEFRVRAGNVTVLMNRMMEIITSLSAAWEGQAAQSYLYELRNLDEDIRRIEFMIREYSSELETIAAHYQQVNQQNIEDILTLPSHVI